VYAVKELCQKHDTVVVCINGDFVTRILRVPSTPRWIVVSSGTDASGTHGDRLEKFRRFCGDLLANNGVQLVINLGNHEFMHPKEVTATLRALVAGGRTHVVSNIDPGNGPLSGLVKPSVAIADMTFVGYCTNEIFGNFHCQLAKNEGYFVGNEQNHRARFKKSIQNVRTPVLVVLSHETRNKSGADVWPMVSAHCPPSVTLKFIAIGHDHYDFRRNNSPRPFKDCRDSYFKDAKRVFCIPPFGYGIGTLRLYKKDLNGKISYHCDTKSLSDFFSGDTFIDHPSEDSFSKRRLITPDFRPFEPRGPIPVPVY
jgi:hypothetical protein